ncbi:MAG: hypothetical protein ACLFTB_02120 [Desulfovibrionales bacterium]
MITIQRILMALLFGIFLMIGGIACEQEGPVEQTGEEIGETTDEAGEEMEESAEEAEEEMEED